MNNNNTSSKKIYFLLCITFLFFFILISKAYSEEKIGIIIDLKNEVYAINTDGEKRLLDLYDEIFLQDEVLTNELSSAIAQYDDKSTVIIKKLSSFKVSDFNITGLKDIFFGKVNKGSVIIESGRTAKKNNGSMIIELPKMTLEIKGTRFAIESKPDGTSEVGLSEDSYGNIGTINISSEGVIKTLYNINQVVTVNIETGISERPKTDDEKKELTDVSNNLVEANLIDENKVQTQLEEKLINGSLLDANSDGILDLSDVELIKDIIITEKKEKLKFIVENSTSDNTEFLSNILNKSDEANIGQSIDKIFKESNNLIVSVITNLSNQDSTFITTSNSEENNIIKEKIYTQMLTDTSNVDVIGKIISKSDIVTIKEIIKVITISDSNDDNSNLSLQVLSAVADATSVDEVSLESERQTEVNKLIESAVANANNDSESTKLLSIVQQIDNLYDVNISPE